MMKKRPNQEDKNTGKCQYCRQAMNDLNQISHNTYFEIEALVKRSKAILEAQIGCQDRGSISCCTTTLLDPRTYVIC